jgi:hypothetical protein
MYTPSTCPKENRARFGNSPLFRECFTHVPPCSTYPVKTRQLSSYPVILMTSPDLPTAKKKGKNPSSFVSHSYAGRKSGEARRRSGCLCITAHVRHRHESGGTGRDLRTSAGNDVPAGERVNEISVLTPHCQGFFQDQYHTRDHHRNFPGLPRQGHTTRNDCNRCTVN